MKYRSVVLVFFIVIAFICGLGVYLLSNPYKPSENASLTDHLRGGALSPELFTLPTGINEFDLLYEDGMYHLFYDDKSSTKHRSAKTIEELSSSTDDMTINGRYPTAYKDEKGVWHVWVYHPPTKTTQHFTSSNAAGPYSYRDAALLNLADWHVRKSPLDQKYYATYKDINTKMAGIARADTPYGPWTDLGPIFSELGQAPWHALEEADAAIFFHESRVYVSFAGWDGKKQRVALVELNSNTMKAASPAIALVEPIEPWQTRNSQAKIFNPVFLEQTIASEKDRIYYAHNSDPGSDTAVPSGWGYLEVGKPPQDGRNAFDAVRLDFSKNNKDIATGITPNLWGSSKINNDSLTTQESLGGIFGHLSLTKLTDFEMSIDFLPASQKIKHSQLLGRISSQQPETGPFIRLWITPDQRVQAEIRVNDKATKFVMDSNTLLPTGKRSIVTLKKKADNIELYIDDHLAASAKLSGSIEGLEEFALANMMGNQPMSEVEPSQFIGKIYKFICISSNQ
ncbi:family 43 glycosylhydrolase [Paenibacillus naphthalenovorans]|uniref:family 43 glycosylhydrolase n=1 Tax=Paenibacillus naphthalenovorans TaxID=162209 RepID=UPI00088BCC70|nr:family 43 glycosylhydrolase [Paenibacillus naphthalenovorans]SDJ98737.1 Glycosyl hydrolases family 43 [Paenibacillus naphthalenovorans]